MELEDFIRGSLESILKGVHSANANLEPGKDKLKPFILLRGGGDNDKDRHIEFDVAVTTGKARGAKAGINVAMLNAGIGAWGRTSEERFSRIRFRVTINEHLV